MTEEVEEVEATVEAEAPRGGHRDSRTEEALKALSRADASPPPPPPAPTKHNQEAIPERLDTQEARLIYAEGWRAVIDNNTRRVYYANKKTKKTQWRAPTVVLAPGWAKNKDPASGRYYYYHKDSGVTTWELNGSFATATQDPVAKKSPRRESNGGGGPGGEGSQSSVGQPGLHLHQMLRRLSERSRIIELEHRKATVWRKFRDARSGRDYYYNRITHESTWKAPADLAGETVLVTPRGDDEQEAPGLDSDETPVQSPPDHDASVSPRRTVGRAESPVPGGGASQKQQQQPADDKPERRSEQILRQVREGTYQVRGGADVEEEEEEEEQAPPPPPAREQSPPVVSSGVAVGDDFAMVDGVPYLPADENWREGLTKTGKPRQVEQERVDTVVKDALPRWKQYKKSKSPPKVKMSPQQLEQQRQFEEQRRRRSSVGSVGGQAPGLAGSPRRASTGSVGSPGSPRSPGGLGSPRQDVPSTPAARTEAGGHQRMDSARSIPPSESAYDPDNIEWTMRPRAPSVENVSELPIAHMSVSVPSPVRPVKNVAEVSSAQAARGSAHGFPLENGKNKEWSRLRPGMTAQECHEYEKGTRKDIVGRFQKTFKTRREEEEARDMAAVEAAARRRENVERVLAEARNIRMKMRRRRPAKDREPFDASTQGPSAVFRAPRGWTPEGSGSPASARMRRSRSPESDAESVHSTTSAPGLGVSARRAGAPSPSVRTPLSARARSVSPGKEGSPQLPYGTSPLLRGNPAVARQMAAAPARTPTVKRSGSSMSVGSEGSTGSTGPRGHTPRSNSGDPRIERQRRAIQIANERSRNFARGAQKKQRNKLPVWLRSSPPHERGAGMVTVRSPSLQSNSSGGALAERVIKSGTAEALPISADSGSP